MTASQAKVVRFHETGDASVLKIELEPLQTPGDDEVRINVEAIGLNRAEVMFRRGAYLEQPQLPSKLGYEAAGVIAAMGKGVTAFKVGDRVSTIPGFSMSRYGVYGESPVVPAMLVAKYPDSLTPEQGASIWMQYITAYGALVDVGRLTKGQSVVITAASSSVGLAAIQIAKILGANIIATTRGDTKVQALIDAGADHVIQTDNENFAARVLEITKGRGAELIFDAIAGPFLEKSAAAAARGGKIIVYGALDGRPATFPLFAALGKGLAIHGYTLAEVTLDPARLKRAKDFILGGLKSGTLVPVIDCVFPFEDIQKAHRYMESNQQIGKIVVTV
jgi:NADPH:quinone reductase-like Zn-dependent oxidoreductase